MRVSIDAERDGSAHRSRRHPTSTQVGGTKLRSLDCSLKSNNDPILLKRDPPGALKWHTCPPKTVVCPSAVRARGCQKGRYLQPAPEEICDAPNSRPFVICSLADLAGAKRGFGRTRERIGRPVRTRLLRTGPLQLPQHHLHLWRSPLFQLEPVLLSRVLPLPTAAGSSVLAAPSSMFGSPVTVLNRRIDPPLGWQCRPV
jgi:hypothetical protein